LPKNETGADFSAGFFADAVIVLWKSEVL